MFLRKSLISLSLLALMALPVLAQEQGTQAPGTAPSTSQQQASPSQSSQAPASQSQTPKDQTAPASSTQSSGGTASAPTAEPTSASTSTGQATAGQTTAGQTPAAPQGPAPTTTPAPDAASSANGDAASTTTPPIQEPDDSKVKHDGGEDDVDAIGNRKIGGRGLGNWYSLETEIRMGKQYSMQVESTVKLVQDPVVNEYVNRIGQNLVRNSDAQVPFTIKVIDSDEVNAFALPGGFFYVNSGLILAADEEAELAGVMAHEISHVAARHGTRQMTRAQLAN
ncbi:MAG: M48 family metalloprotease, partial [Terriglobales bacterium]